MTKPHRHLFQDCRRKMRKRNGLIREEGFHELLPFAFCYVDELITEATIENDPGLQSWLYELLGASKDPSAIPVFWQLLNSDQRDHRWWGVRGLREINTKESRKQLFEAGIAGDADYNNV